MRRLVALLAVAIILFAPVGASAAGKPKVLSFTISPASELRWGGQLVDIVTVRHGDPRLYVMFHCVTDDGAFQQRGEAFFAVPGGLVTVSTPAMPLIGLYPDRASFCNTRLYGLDRAGQPTGDLMLGQIWFRVSP